MATTLDALSADLQSYVVAPLNAFGLGGFLFDAEGESTARLSADITDHYTEDNRAVQDHIAIHPNRITLKGYVGEVTYTQPGKDQSFLQTAVQKLTTISAFLPLLSSSAVQMQAAIASPVNSDITLSDASNIYGLVKNLIATTGDEARQQNAFLYFKSLMNQGVLMGVQTPWEFITNMVVESIIAIQPETSKYITDFSITLKQIRIAKTKTTAYGGSSKSGSFLSGIGSSLGGIATSVGNAVDNAQATVMQGVASIQSALETNIGNVTGISLPTDILPGWQSQLNSVQDIVTNPGAMSILKGAGAQ